MLFRQAYGIDPGSNMIKIYSRNRDEIWKEHNVLAVRNRRQLLAVGDEAYEMYEKAPQNVVISFPMMDGMIANASHLDIVLHTLLERYVRHIGRRPSIYLAVPADMTEIEKRAYRAVAQSGRFRQCRVYLVEKPIADALALGVPIMKTRGTMIVNIGAASTEMSVIADARIILSRAIPLGGNRFDQEIMGAVRRKHHFMISQKAAGRLKYSLANLGGASRVAGKMIGIDTVSGLPREKAVTSDTVSEAVRALALELAGEIRTFLERTPPQIRRHIQEEGIYLTGGSSRIPHLDRMLSAQAGCPVLLSQYYELCTIYGLKEIMTHDALRHWAVPPKKRR